MVIATWRLETGNGTSPMWLYQNNAGGIKRNGVYHTFDSQESGWKALEDLLYNDYYLVYGLDLRAIRNRYCGIECGEEDLIKFTEIYNEELAKLEKRR